MNRETALLLRIIDQAFDRPSWHGPNLRNSIRGLSARDAAWRPGKGRHSVQEIAVHAAYWKYVVRRRLLGEKRGSFPLAGSNWFPRVAPDTREWKEDVRLLEEQHTLLRRAVATVPAADLEKPLAGGTVTPLVLISGIAAHDLYHAGQIQLLKRMLRARS